MNKILIVEDEIAIVDLLKIGLRKQGYICEYALDGLTASNLIEKNKYDLILLDIMLPNVNGYELLEYIKPLSIPVIYITAKGETKDKVKGLTLGAEDYIVKPFELDEVVARVNTILRRFHKNQDIIHLYNIEINTLSRIVSKDGIPINLTPKEYDLLLVLLDNKNTVVYREYLFNKVWEDDILIETRTLDLHIQRLRKKLDLKDHIKTIFKVGYMLEVKQ